MESKSREKAVFYRHRTYQISKAYWKITEKDWQDWLVNSGLNINEHHILLTLYTSGKMNITQLSHYGMMHVSTALNFSKKLNKDGLVVFSKDTKDRRITYIDITDEGRALVEKIEEDWNYRESSLLNGTQALVDFSGCLPIYADVVNLIRSYYGVDVMEFMEEASGKLTNKVKDLDFSNLDESSVE